MASPNLGDGKIDVAIAIAPFSNNFVRCLAMVMVSERLTLIEGSVSRMTMDKRLLSHQAVDHGVSHFSDLNMHISGRSTTHMPCGWQGYFSL